MDHSPQSPDAPVRVVLADDHEFFRRGLRELLEEHGFEIVGEARDGEEAVSVTEEAAPDVALMDIHMPGTSGIEATRRIRLATPLTRVVMLTVSADQSDVDQAVLAGACGYVLKDAAPDAIVSGVRSAAAGESLLSPRIATTLLDRMREDLPEEIPESTLPSLTDRELEVLRLLAEGKENNEIAADLFISTQTVKSHVSNILAKLEVQNRIQAAVYAIRRRIL